MMVSVNARPAEGTTDAAGVDLHVDRVVELLVAGRPTMPICALPAQRPSLAARVSRLIDRS